MSIKPSHNCSSTAIIKFRQKPNGDQATNPNTTIILISYLVITTLLMDQTLRVMFILLLEFKVAEYSTKNKALCHKEYFELEATEKKQNQEKLYLAKARCRFTNMLLLFFLSGTIKVDHQTLWRQYKRNVHSTLPPSLFGPFSI